MAIVLNDLGQFLDFFGVDFDRSICLAILSRIEDYVDGLLLDFSLFGPSI